MLHLKDNIKIIRALLGQTQLEFIKNFSGKITIDMQKSYESGKAKPDILYIQELADISGVSEKDLLSKNLKKTDIKGEAAKVTKGEIVYKVKGPDQEKSAANPHIELLAADDFKVFRGLVVAKLATIEANIKALNNKVAQINEEVTGVKSTITLAELEQTTKSVAKMLQDELVKMFP